MVKVKRVSAIAIALALGVSSVNGGMVEQVLYNVVGQVSNAVGARLGDEIYYGSSGHQHRRVVHHHRKRHHKKKKKQVKKAVIPVMTDEKKIQKALASLGFYKGKIDGQINSYETRSAIRAMNRAYGLGNNAFLSPQVKDSLIYLGELFRFDRALIASGSDKKIKGKKLQTALKVLGFYQSKIDGLVGSGTRSSIAAYKSANGMSANGTLDYEEEYRLITKAKEMNDKNIDETITSIRSFARTNQMQPRRVGISSKAVSRVQGQMQPQYRQNQLQPSVQQQLPQMTSSVNPNQPVVKSVPKVSTPQSNTPQQQSNPNQDMTSKRVVQSNTVQKQFVGESNIVNSDVKKETINSVGQTGQGARSVVAKQNSQIAPKNQQVVSQKDTKQNVEQKQSSVNSGEESVNQDVNQNSIKNVEDSKNRESTPLKEMSGEKIVKNQKSLP